MDQVNDLNLDLSNLSGLVMHVKANAHLIHEYTDGDPPRLDMRAFKGALDRYAMDLIIEKIETEDMLLDLLELKIDFGQGYLFENPGPAPERTDVPFNNAAECPTRNEKACHEPHPRLA